jgi:hypothetical protein
MHPDPKFRKPYGNTPYNKPTYNKPAYNKKPKPKYEKTPIAAVHSTMRCLTAMGRPMFDTQRRAKELLAVLENNKDAPLDVIAGIKDTLAVFDDLFYNYSVIFGNLHLAAHSLFKNKTSSMEEQYESDEGNEEEE